LASEFAEWSDVPIFILSAPAAEDRKIAALNGGANDSQNTPSAW